MAAVFDLGDGLTLAGAALIAIGLWPIWTPGSWLIPGAVCLWYGLPTRPPFIARER